MSELGLDSRYNLINMLKMNGANGATLNMGEGLTETNEMFQDAIILPANDVLSHEDMRAASLPTPQVVKVGDGWSASVAMWDKYKDDISILKDRGQWPEDVLKLAGDMAKKRNQCEKLHMEGFGQGAQNLLLYGTNGVNPETLGGVAVTAAPEKFTGLASRYYTPDASDPWSPTNGDYGVLDLEGTGADTTSVWLIQWGENGTTLRTPMNDPNMGIYREDMGRQLVTAENSKSRWDYITEFGFKFGPSIKDIRSIVRIRNIESDVASLSTNLVKKIVEAREYFNGPAPFVYTNRRIRTHLRLLAMDKNNVQYSSENPYKIPLMMIDDMPVRRCDAILNTETAVTAA